MKSLTEQLNESIIEEAKGQTKYFLLTFYGDKTTDGYKIEKVYFQVHFDTETPSKAIFKQFSHPKPSVLMKQLKDDKDPNEKYGTVRGVGYSALPQMTDTFKGFIYQLGVDEKTLGKPDGKGAFRSLLMLPNDKEYKANNGEEEFGI